MRKREKLDPEAIRALISARSREPFAEFLELALGSAPDESSIKKFAEKYPDRWAQMVTMLARLTGYTEKTAVQHNHTLVDARTMGDAELMHEIGETQKKLKHFH